MMLSFFLKDKGQKGQKFFFKGQRTKVFFKGQRTKRTKRTARTKRTNGASNGQLAI